MEEQNQGQKKNEKEEKCRLERQENRVEEVIKDTMKKVPAKGGWKGSK